MQERHRPPERFYDRQYPLALQVRYRVYQGLRLIDSGRGETLFIGVRNVLFLAPQPLDSGLFAELSVDWPVRLDNGTPLQFCVEGEIVLSAGNRVLVRVLHHDFKVKPQLAKAATAGTRNPEDAN